MQYLRYFRLYVKLYGRYFWTGVIALAFTDGLDVLPPLIIMRGVDQITRNAGMQALLQTALLFAGLTLALAWVRFHWRMQYGKFHQNLARHMRERIFQKLTELGPSFYAQNPIGELMSLMSNDVESIRMGMGPGFIILVDALLYFLTIPPIMLSISVPLTFKTLALLPILPFFINWLGNIIHRKYLEVQDAFGAMSGVTQENITGIRVVKSYVQEKNQIDFFNKTSRVWRDKNLAVAWAESFMHPVMEFCVSVGIVALIYLGSKDVIGGTLTLGAFVAFQRYILKMVWPMTAVGWGFSLVSQSRASLQRLDEFFNTKPEVANPGQLQEAYGQPASPKEEKSNSREVGNFGTAASDGRGQNSNPRQPLNLNGSIEVRNLTFQYPGSNRPALKHINLSIKPGETFGVVGPVGAGKTTLAQLLCHLFEVERNQIVVNGHDIRDIPLHELRRHISFVPQDTFLFSASITENMAFGVDQAPDVSALARVAQIAKLDEEIESLPNRYDTYLGERGVNLSGGQKQRMTITRALLRNSPVIIFDDSLSAVDAETESLILARLREETRRHTTIIISHRLSSLSLCDKIVVLKEGQIEALGTPVELRSSSSTYQELLELQGYA